MKYFILIIFFICALNAHAEKLSQRQKITNYYLAASDYATDNKINILYTKGGLVFVPLLSKKEININNMINFGNYYLLHYQSDDIEAIKYLVNKNKNTINPYLNKAENIKRKGLTFHLLMVNTDKYITIINKFCNLQIKSNLNKKVFLAVSASYTKNNNEACHMAIDLLSVNEIDIISENGKLIAQNYNKAVKLDK